MKRSVVLVMVLFLAAFVVETNAQKNEVKSVCFKTNMHCGNCQNKLTEYLKFEKGVVDLKVDLETNTIKVDFKESKNNEDNFARGIEKKGYTAEKISTEAYEKIVKESKPKEQ